jgi:hypothetical protein
LVTQIYVYHFSLTHEGTIDNWRSQCKSWILWPTPCTYINSCGDPFFFTVSNLIEKLHITASYIRFLRIVLETWDWILHQVLYSLINLVTSVYKRSLILFLCFIFSGNNLEPDFTARCMRNLWLFCKHDIRVSTWGRVYLDDTCVICSDNHSKM